jgi:hypothetical protein
MTDAQSENQTRREPVRDNGLAVWGLLLIGLVVGVLVAMSRLEEPIHAYFRKIPDGKRYWDKYVEGLALPGVAICIYAGLLVGTGMIILSSYRAIRALVRRPMEIAEDDPPEDSD